MTTNDVTVKTTSELTKGDIVHTHGMRLRLDIGAAHTRPSGTFYVWTGTVLNIDYIREQDIVPTSYLRTQRWEEGKGWVTDREDVYVVTGIEYQNWLVENPA
ncbi:hypothetical protein AB0C52_12715 [Streptomyces sp. NPDC048717]|uniref:hypothetical protein n=1 Tax=Streptomyces sp. NPDC048717 TaxID=3154928 RepID=UPI00343493AE